MSRSTMQPSKDYQIGKKPLKIGINDESSHHTTLARLYLAPTTLVE